MHVSTPRPTIDYEPGGIWIKFPFSSTYLAQVSNGTDAKKSSGKTEDKIIAIARKSPSVSFRKLPRSWASAHAPWKNKFAISSKPIASAASDQPRVETGKSSHEDPTALLIMEHTKIC